MPANIDPKTPVLAGVGQVAERWDGVDPAAAPSPSSLRLAASELALADSGASACLRELIDTVVVVRTNLDSIPRAPQPFGRAANPPASLAASLGLSPARLIYSAVGGDQPQTLFNEFAEEIFHGRSRAVLLSGAEAMATMKQAIRSGQTLDWSEPSEQTCEDRGLGEPLLSAYEYRNGLGMPTQTYPIFEHALRHRLGHSRSRHRAVMGELWEGFSKVAAHNPYARFPTERSRQFLQSDSDDNYPVADPYLKWHVAQDAVDQGAALVLTSFEQARAAGVPESQLIYLHGYSSIRDKHVCEREDISRSVAIEEAIAIAFRASGRSAEDISLYDLYSCFPCAVLLAAEAIGLDWREGPFTVTGGLPFFGGAGNNYSMHAIAEMAIRLRKTPTQYGLVLANGGFLTKESVGIYSAEPPKPWRCVSSREVQAKIDALPAPPLLTATTQANIESYTVVYEKGQPVRGYVLATSSRGRILARIGNDARDILETLAATDPLGSQVCIRCEEGINRVESMAIRPVNIPVSPVATTSH